ncbi:hypothetical protein NPIL_691851 [Nephila pilipes]|uniref:Uncharacterized protein n=1 Tax=Nephila pilipes TaxID=299642 RepID=A0A8X6P081_NEPPI|nr:hypothetical protein NPIL_691851 [Nephila pilipes]
MRRLNQSRENCSRISFRYFIQIYSDPNPFVINVRSMDHGNETDYCDRVPIYPVLIHVDETDDFFWDKNKKEL